MIEFLTVSREFRSLVGRRRELRTLLGSVFAGLGIALQNALQGGLPESLGEIRRHVFAFYAVMLMVPCLLLALRMARLHAGLVLNGILFARLMQDQDFSRPPSIDRAARHNFTGASFLQFALMDLIAGFSTTVLASALEAPPAVALAGGVGVVAAWMGLYFRFHRDAVRFARGKAASDRCAPFAREDWERHISGSLEDANTDLNAEVAFIGLMTFSVFETLSGLGQVKAAGIDIAAATIQRFAPTAYVGLLFLSCAMGMLAYLRVRVAVGRYSLLLDPTDRPFRVFRLTDSLLGYLIVAFLAVVSLHLLLGLLIPPLAKADAALLAIDAAAMALAVAAEQLTLLLAGRAHRPLETPAAQ